MRLHSDYFAVATVGCARALAVLGLWSAAAHGLTVSPVLVELSPARRVSSITLSNPGDRAVSFQTQTLAWSHSDGIDRYEDTSEIVVVPPIADIAAGGSQIFRVMARAPKSAQERAYRLIFEDVSEVIAPAASSNETSINIRVNHNLPVFIAAEGKPQSRLRAGACVAPLDPKRGCVRLENDGNRYAQVKALTIESGTWRQQIQASSRVLAGAWRQWTFEVPDNVTGPLKVTADTRDGLVTAELPPTQR